MAAPTPATRRPPLPKAARRALVGIAAISIGINALALTGSLYMLQVYDRVLPSNSIPTLIALSLLAAALFSFYGALNYFRRGILGSLAAWLDALISPQVYDASLRLALAPTLQNDKINPLRDLDAVRAFICGPALGVLFDLPWMPFYFGLIYLFHPMLGGLAVAGMLMLVAVAALTDHGTREATEKGNAAAVDRQRTMEIARRNAETLTALGMAHSYFRIWNDTHERYLISQQRIADVGGSFSALSQTLRMMLQSAVLGLGAYLVIQQEASPGVMIAASIITGRALAPLDLAIPNWKGWVAARQSWKRLSYLLSAVAARTEKLPLRVPKDEVVVENATAVPPGVRKAIVENASFQLRSGQGLGIIGPSAAGKSSLARLLVGVWTPTAGKVRLDGAALDQWQPEELGRHIGYLPQAIELFPGTIADNIARFEPKPEAEAIIRAAEAAGVHDLIVNLPEGYQTSIGEHGAGLSAGQQQRIALARALYRDPFLVVLDEPNSNLDGEGESALTLAILGVRARGGIVIVIAHHAAALAGVDTLLVMTGGRVKAFGSKDEVMAKIVRPTGPTPAFKVVSSDPAGAAQ